MWTLEQVRAEYHRLDRLLGIDTSGIAGPFFQTYDPAVRRVYLFEKQAAGDPPGGLSAAGGRRLLGHGAA